MPEIGTFACFGFWNMPQVVEKTCLVNSLFCEIKYLSQQPPYEGLLYYNKMGKIIWGWYFGGES